jgi:SAM-dependent methyltransferase
MAADTVVELYHEHATAWVERRGSGLAERWWLDAFLAAMPREGRAVLDIGCGSGQPIAGHLIGRGCRLTGVDGAAALIEIARQTFPGQTWIASDMRHLPPLPRFHGLVAWHSVFHLKPDDQRPMFETFGRLGHPGAALLFTSGPAQGEVLGVFEGRPLYHASLDAAEYRHLLRDNGFEVLKHVENDPTCGGATIWLARKAPDADR